MPEKGSNSPGQSSFGERLRRARTGQQRTLRQIASSAGVSIAYLSDLERGVLENPTLDKLRGIAEALDVSLNDLLEVPPSGGESHKPEAPALREFAADPQFLATTEQEAERLRRDLLDLRSEWLEMLQGIQLGGSTPRTPSDYAFVFEAIRRALDPR